MFRRIIDHPNLEYVRLIASFVSTVYVFKQYVGQLTVVNGPSMLPTLNRSGDLCICDQFSAQILRHIKVGDIVTCYSPRNRNNIVCKRVKGLAGDVVEVKARNNWESDRKVTVPQGHVWLEGDNRELSIDSREYGPVPTSLITSKIALRIWPLSQFGPLDPLK
ncbi:hypothetical protein CYMTET_27231 [Cymbomonas tetramitiformis]|uniref:Peptidase S26 domain-containing protein n=1 Tax=Cymbomonas tetramitiformis TaxID=36881 RepID=A0AAE0KX43_9CHLO|nr:hypothetical protein CYMTET_27231 [Cymbomonas tetramitiformis]